jgi:hypothetical protein
MNICTDQRRAVSLLLSASLFVLLPTPCLQACAVSDWRSWEPCSGVCANGTAQRSRTVTVPATDEVTTDEMPCPLLTDSSPCEALECIDCTTGSWSAWASCSSECGGGMRSRSRGSIVPPRGVAQDCPVLVEDDACSMQACTWPPTFVQPHTCPACEAVYDECSVALKRAGTIGSMFDVYQLVCIAGGVCEALLACVRSHACGLVDELLDPTAVRTVCASRS